MDLNQAPRGATRKRHIPRLHVIIVGEVFAPNDVHPLSPVAPSDEMPFALLPICNTPLIDYILENLAENGVDEVSILFNSVSINAVRTHLENSRNARGKSWLGSRDMKVELIESVRNMTRLFDATAEIVDRNIVAQNSSFLFVPIDSITFITNLRELFASHEERTKTIKSYAATLLCTSVRTLLKDTLHDILLTELGEQERRSAGNGALKPQRRSVAPMAELPNHITMFVLQKSTGVVRRMVRLEPRDGPAEPTPLEFSRHERVSVRTDLVPTGFLFCSAGALSLFTFHMADQHALLFDIITKHEIWGNVFGVEEVTPAMGFVHPIVSLRAYIQANVHVCSRHFFPFTRDYSFAEASAQYAVAPHCPTVYVHQDRARVLSAACEPCVVVGEGVVVPPSAVVRGAALGRGVRIGAGAVLVGCVVLDDAVIGAGAAVRHSLIGRGAVVGDGAEVAASVIGAGVVIAGRGEEESVVVQAQAIAAETETETKAERETETKAEAAVTGSAGRGRALVARYTSKIVPARELFVQDPVAQAGAGSDDAEDEERDESETEYERFSEAVMALAERALRQPSLIESCMFEMKDVRLTYGMRNSDLCRIVTERLLTHAVVRQEYGERDEQTATKAAEDLFVRWCRPFFYEIVTGDDEMQAVLEATCTAIRDPESPLHTCGQVLLECLYNGCDDDLYDERGFCIVSGESLVDFGVRMQRLAVQRQEQNTLDDEDDDDTEHRSETSSDASNDSREDGMLRVALSCQPFINGVKEFLEEEYE